MQMYIILLSSLCLTACTGSCSKTQSTAATTQALTQETWTIKADHLISSVGFSPSDTIDLTLSKSELKLQQGATSLVFQIVEWEPSGIARLIYRDKKGFFKWDIVPGEKRSEDRTYACSDAPGAPVAVTRVEETKQMRLVNLFIEGPAGQSELINLRGHLPNENLWVETGSLPLKFCKE